MVAALLASGLGAGVAAQRLQAQASDHARVLSLGGDPSALPGARAHGTAEVTYPPDLVCVFMRDELSSGLWAVSPLQLEASACALDPHSGPEPNSPPDE